MRNDLIVLNRIKKELKEVIDVREKVLDDYRNDNNITVYTHKLSLVLYAFGDITSYLSDNKHKLTNKKYTEISEILDANKDFINKLDRKVRKEQFLKIVKGLQFDFSKLIYYVIETHTDTELIVSVKKAKRVLFDIYNQYDGIDYLKKLYLHDEEFSLSPKSGISLFDFLCTKE